MTDNPRARAALFRCLAQIALGYTLQLRPRRKELSFPVLAGILCERGLVRVVKRRDGTRPYVLTRAGHDALVAYQQHGTVTL